MILFLENPLGPSKFFENIVRHFFTQLNTSKPWFFVDFSSSVDVHQAIVLECLLLTALQPIFQVSSTLVINVRERRVFYLDLFPSLAEPLSYI